MERITYAEPYQKAVDGLELVRRDLLEALHIAGAIEAIVLLDLVKQAGELERGLRALAEAKSCG